MCPESEKGLLSVVFQNRAAAYSKLVTNIQFSFYFPVYAFLSKATYYLTNNLQNNNENCVADCDKALALVPTYKKALSRRARALTELGNFKLALEDITAVIMLDEFRNQTDIMFADSVIKSLGNIFIYLYGI